MSEKVTAFEGQIVVALLAEGVGRNCSTSSRRALVWGRPPRGGRG